MTAGRAPVGLTIKAALERAALHQSRCSRKLKIRIIPLAEHGEPRLRIRANIAARTNEELEAQMGLGVREVRLEDLDARADELIGLVDDVVAEVETAVANAPGRQVGRAARARIWTRPRSRR